MIITMTNLKEVNDEILKRVGRLYAQVWQEPPWNEFFWNPQEVAEEIRDLREKEGFVGFVALVGDEPIGFVWGTPLATIPREKIDIQVKGSARVFYLAELAVKREFRRRGLGSALLSLLLQEVKNHGFGAVLLRTHVEAAPARGLYRKFGFRELPVRDKHYPDRSYWLKTF